MLNSPEEDQVQILVTMPSFMNNLRPQSKVSLTPCIDNTNPNKVQNHLEAASSLIVMNHGHKWKDVATEI